MGDYKDCKHTSIEFCFACNRPYCKNCGKVWEEVAGGLSHTSGPTMKVKKMHKRGKEVPGL